MSSEFTSVGSRWQDDATPIGSDETLVKYSQSMGQVKLPNRIWMKQQVQG